MERLIAHVRNGRLVLDEPTDLPEGAEVPLELGDAWDDLDDGERARLNAAITNAWESIQRGEGVPMDEALRRMRARG